MVGSLSDAHQFSLALRIRRETSESNLRGLSLCGGYRFGFLRCFLPLGSLAQNGDMQCLFAQRSGGFVDLWNQVWPQRLRYHDSIVNYVFVTNDYR